MMGKRSEVVGKASQQDVSMYNKERAKRLRRPPVRHGNLNAERIRARCNARMLIMRKRPRYAC